jgi:hypothetical protein
MTFKQFESYHAAHRCKVCGCKQEEHRGGSESSPVFSCPTTLGWGRPAHFPHATYQENRSNNYTEYWHRVEAYWSTGTEFTPIQ